MNLHLHRRMTGPVAIGEAIVQPTRYHAELSSRAWRIINPTGVCVEVVHSARVAAYDVDLLNAGVAHVDPHGLLGCRVVLNTRGRDAA